MSNFAFLQSEWEEIYQSAKMAEAKVYLEPRTCCFYSRFTLEKAVKWLYKNDSYLKYPYADHLSALLHEQTFQENLTPGLFPKLRTIQKVGNLAVHSERKIASSEAVHVLKELHHFLYWMYRDYTSDTQAKDVAFDKDLLPQEQPASDQTTKQLKKLEDESQQKEIELACKEAELRKVALQNKIALEQKEALLKTSEDEKNALLRKLMKLEEERRQQKVQENKKRNETFVDPHDYNEAETRKYIIDLMLKEAGWDLSAPDVKEFEVQGMPTNSGIGYADYVLWGDNGLPLAVVEAKRTTTDAKIGKNQAELYAKCLQKMKGQRPIIFYTNGYQTFIWDDDFYPPRPVQGFYKKDELQRLIDRRTDRKPLSQAVIKEKIVDRYYHKSAIKHICDAFENHHRKSLLVMATGTGKTRTACSLIDVLQKNNWIKNVLFLADRNALLTQAKKVFSEHLPHSAATIVSSKEHKFTNRICLSTYPTMLNLISESKNEGETVFSIGHFDLIVIDEAHRSVYKKYKAIFDYFDALLVGLTATPKDEVDRNTYSLFDLEPGLPTYAYESEKAYADGFLVPPKAYDIPVKFHREGIQYDDLTDEEKAEYEEMFYDQEEDGLPDSIPAAALNKWLFNKDTVDKILTTLMEYGLKVENGDKLGKTIIFAKNIKHAEFILERFDANYPKHAGHFARLVAHQEPYVQTVIDDFRDGVEPTIAVSVDMLDTGIDVPSAVNLLFFKVVKSKSKFTQMIGRGTRLYPDLFGPDQDKQFFLIFDCCENFEYFRNNPADYQPGKEQSLSENIFLKRLKLAQSLKNAQDSQAKALRKEVLDTLCQEVAEMNPENFMIRPKMALVEKFKIREQWDALGQSEISEIKQELVGLPSEFSTGSPFEKQFDSLILTLQLAVVEAGKGFETTKAKIQEIASSLEEKNRVPAVKKQMELILDIQTEAFWQDITVSILEDLRINIRSLAQFINKNNRKILYSDFQDEVGMPAEISGVRNITSSYSELAQYRKKVEAFIKSRDDHLAIQKLKRNKPLTPDDLRDLEAMLFSSDVVKDRATFEKAYREIDSLTLFIRQLVGLDQESAKAAFGKYLDTSVFSGKQIDFINMIINFLTKDGIFDAEKLYKTPFIDVHQGGIDELFPKNADRIVGIIEAINENARFVA